MLFTDVQRSVRLNKKKKSTNTSPYPDEVIDRLARAFYPAILACWNSEEGQRSLVGAKPLHLLTQTVPSLKSPTGAFIATQTRIFQNCLFTGGVVTESSICRAAAGNEPSQAHCVRQLPRKGELFVSSGQHK